MKEKIVTSKKTENWSLEKIKKKKIDKPLARLIKKKIKKVREKNQIHKIRNEKGEVTIDNAKIKRIIRDYYEQLYGNKIDNLKEIDRFLEKFNLPRLNKVEIEIMNNPVTSTETEALIKKVSQKTKAHPQPDCITREFYQTFRKKLMPILLKLFQKISEEVILPNSFDEVTITLIPKPNNDNTKK